MFYNILIVELKHLGTRVEQRKCEGSMCWNVTWSEGSLKNEKVQTKKTGSTSRQKSALSTIES